MNKTNLTPMALITMLTACDPASKPPASNDEAGGPDEPELMCVYETRFVSVTGGWVSDIAIVGNPLFNAKHCGHQMSPLESFDGWQCSFNGHAHDNCVLGNTFAEILWNDSKGVRLAYDAITGTSSLDYNVWKLRPEFGTTVRDMSEVYIPSYKGPFASSLQKVRCKDYARDCEVSCVEDWDCDPWPASGNEWACINNVCRATFIADVPPPETLVSFSCEPYVCCSLAVE